MRASTYFLFFFSTLLFLVFFSGRSEAQSNAFSLDSLKKNPTQMVNDSLAYLSESEFAEYRMQLIAASPQEKERILKEVNKRRTLMLLREWWRLPTEKDIQRNEKGLYARFNQSLLPIGGEDYLVKAEEQTTSTKYKKRVLAEQNIVSMGWHPYWMGSTTYTPENSKYSIGPQDTMIDTYHEYSFSLLTHVAYYSYELNPYTGGYKNFEAIYTFKHSDFIETAHLDTCKVLLSVSCKGPDAALFFTGEEVAKTNLIDSLKSILLEANADGIELSFEEVPRKYKKEFIQFVQDLSYELREQNNSYTIMMSIPVYDHDNVYDLKALRPWVDFFIISSFNHHVRSLGLVRGAIAPLQNPEALIRDTRLTYSSVITLDSVLKAQDKVAVSSLELLLSRDSIAEFIDTVNFYIEKHNTRERKFFQASNLEGLLSILRTDAAAGLRQEPIIAQWLQKIPAVVELSTTLKAAQQVRFFLFEPEPTETYILEYEQFAQFANSSPARQISNAYVVRDTFGKLNHIRSNMSNGETTYDLRYAVQQIKEELGEEFKSSLVLGLPYHGAVWNTRSNEPIFEGYAPYGQIREILRTRGGDLYFDKYYNSMVLELADDFGALREIYFDNSSTLQTKIEYALDEGMAGVSMWAMGYDYGSPELWTLLEESFLLPRTYNPETHKFEKVTIEKSNKIEFTILYQLKRFSRIIFATFFIAAIFMVLGFNVVMLDWKVRDILFYTGSFRIFYLTLATMIILFIGSSIGVFENPWIALLVGILLGLSLTWIATYFTNRRQEKLP